MDGPPPPEEDFSSIPVLERIVHKNWKARLDGYEALPKLFSLTTSDNDPAFRPYLSDPGLLKKIVTDANAVAQEKGVEAVVALVQYSGENSAKTRDAVVPALVDKCLGSARAGTKSKAIELILRYIEVENNGEGVVRDILPGLNAKQPKIVSGTVTALNEAFKAFGIKVIPPKEALKTLPKIFGHSDKTVRAEGTSLVQTLYTFLGQGIQPFLSDLKPVQVKELNESFTKLDESNSGQGTGKQTRFTRAQERERQAAEEAGVVDDVVVEEEEPPDPRLLVDEVDIVPKLPADFHTLVASSKWKERKEALDATLELVNANPRIKDSDGVSELAKALGKRMTDANIQCVIAAAQVIEGLSKSIGHPFSKYKPHIVPPMLARFKERKQNVVDAIGQGLDAFFATTTLPDVTEEILAPLKDKNPQVKEGTAKFLARCLGSTRIPPAKGDVKPMSEALVVLLEDSYEPVRAAAADGLGTLLKIVGERQLNPVLDPLDDLRKAKVKEAAEKATVKCKAGAAPAPKSAPANGAPKGMSAGKKSASSSTAQHEFDVDATPKAKPPARLVVKKAPALATTDEEIRDNALELPKAKPPARFMKKGSPVPPGDDEEPKSPAAKPPPRALTKKPPGAAAPTAKKLAPVAAPTKPVGKATSAPASEPVKFKFTPEDAEAMAADLIPLQIATDLGDSNWKVRLAAMEELNTWLEGGAAESAEPELIVRFLSKKPGWNEKNFQVSTKVYAALTVLAERSPAFSKACIVLSTGHLSEKLGDMKLKKPAGDTMLVYAEKTSLSFVLDQAYDPLSKQKAPKVLADSITWIGQALTDFGIAGLSLRSLVEFLKTALKNSNAGVRSSATNTLVTLRLFAGSGIRDLLEDLNPQLLTTIEGEFAKVDGQPAPAPIRFSADVAAATSSSAPGKAGLADPLDELFPHVDLDKLVGGTTILVDAKSDAWKTRKEALELLQSMLDAGANKRLKPNMGDIGQVLKARLGDSNKVVQALALDIVARVATAMNKPFEKHCRLLVRPVADVLTDQKANIRSLATTTLSAIASACEGIDSMVNPLSGALESTNPLLRASLLAWLAEWFSSHPPPTGLDLSPWTTATIGALEDRNGDVRKGAHAVLPSLITSVGFEVVVDKVQGLKPASRNNILPFVQALKPTKGPAPATTVLAPTQPIVKPTQIEMLAEPEQPAAVAVAKRPAATNLRLRKLDSAASRPLSRAESLADGPASSSSNGTLAAQQGRPGASRPVSSVPTTPAPSASGSSIFSGSSLDVKRSRLGKENSRWVVEGLPVRKDLAETLHHQMEAHIVKDVLGLLFSKSHDPVNDYVKGLSQANDAYIQGLDEEDVRTVLVANSDLCFKYVSLRIHEPQPNLVMRCVDLLDNVVALLIACDYSIVEPEAQCFIPTIINKLGDSREVVRHRIQTIIQNLSKIYPASRLFQLLLDHGLKSKVAKTRQGALEELGNVLKRVGLSSCDPAKAFPVMASMIGDKDTNVRKAALSAISEGYVLAGDKVWQYVGQLSLKDKTQLEERLKRTAGPSNPTSPAKYDSLDSPVAPQRVSRLATNGGRPSSPSHSKFAGGIPRPASPASSLPSARPTSPSPVSLASPPPSTGGTGPSPGRPRSLLPSRLGPRSRLAPQTAHTDADIASSSRSNGTTNGLNGHAMHPSHSDDLLPTGEHSGDVSITISSILSSDPARSVDALKKIQKILDAPTEEDRASPAFKELAEHTEGLIETVTLQMSHIFERPEEVADPASFRLAKHLIQTLNAFCEHPVLAESLTVEILTSLLEELTMRLLQTDESADPKVKDLSRFINMIVLRIFSTGRRISIFRALFALLLQIMKPFPANGATADSRDAKLAELVLKCVWKMARSIPQEFVKGTLDAVELFPAIEQFLQSIPPNEWRQRGQNHVPLGDMPLRTIKVIIQHVVAHYPDQVYDQLSEAFDDPSATIVYPYVYRILNSAPSRPTTGTDEGTRMRSSSSKASSLPDTMRSASPSSNHTSPPMEGADMPTPMAGRRETSLFDHYSNGSSKPAAPFGYGTSGEPDPDDRLIEIIDHISSETTGAMHKEGITELHHFLKEYPHKKAKVDKMLDATGPAFRKYIARALASRAAEDEEREVVVADTLSKLEHRREPVTGSLDLTQRDSGTRTPSLTGSPRRVSGGTERRFSAATAATGAEDKALSRLHDIFQYHGRTSISLTSSQRGSFPNSGEA